MAKSTTPRVPGQLKIRTPRSEIERMTPARAPLRTSGGKDVISTVTRMRETPPKKSR